MCELMISFISFFAVFIGFIMMDVGLIEAFIFI